MVTADPLRPDGSLLFPPETLRAVMGYLSRKLRQDLRQDGGGASAALVVGFIEACAESVRLREVLEAQGFPTSEEAAGPAARVWVSATEAAGRMGCSSRRVRQLARDGRLTARLSGGVWLIAADEIDRPRAPRRAA